MTHAAARRACHPCGQSTTIWKLPEISGLADPLHTRVASGVPAFGSCAGMIMPAGRLADLASRQETLGAIDTAVRPNAFAARSTRSRPARPSQGTTAAPTVACSPAPREGERVSQDAEVLAAEPRTGKVVAPLRDRHWPPPSTRPDRRPVYPRTLRQHREASIISGHSRSATAHPGYSPTRSPGSGKQQPRRVTL